MSSSSSLSRRQAQLCELSELMERVRKEKFSKPRITFNTLPKINSEKDLKEKEDISKNADIEDNDENDTK
jgi:hypothetical protein